MLNASNCHLRQVSDKKLKLEGLQFFLHDCILKLEKHFKIISRFLKYDTFRESYEQ